MAPTAPLPDLPPPPVTGTVGDGRPIMIALSLTVLGGTLAHWRLDAPRTLAEIIGASLAFGGIAQSMAMRLGFSGADALEGMGALKRFPLLKAAPWHIRAAFVMIPLGLSPMADGQGWQLAPDLLGVLTGAWLMPELVRTLDGIYCSVLCRMGVLRRARPPLPMALIQGVAMLQAVVGLAFVITR
jgi:hypothetical protein